MGLLNDLVTEGNLSLLGVKTETGVASPIKYGPDFSWWNGYNWKIINSRPQR